MNAVQTELFSLTADSFDAPLHPWDWENQHQSVQDRSVDEWRRIYVERSRQDRYPSISPDRCDRALELGTIAQQSLTDNELGTITEQSLTTVPNRKLKYHLPGMYRDWVKSEWYWKIKVYVGGKRKTYHLHKNYGEAIAIGRKILADLGKTV